MFVVLLLGTVQAVENQNPIDGSTVAPGDVELSWTNLDQAVSVDVYFTNDKSVLEFGTVEELQPIKIISEGVDVNSVIVRARPSTQYYWTVDTYVGDPNAPIYGPIFSFTTEDLPPEVAETVSPLDGAVDVNTIELVLEWEAGQGAINYDVYFGTDANDLGVLAEDLTETSYLIPQVLILGQTYYWRVDANDGSAVYTGWTVSFTTTEPAGTTAFTNGDPDNSLWSSPDNWSNGLPGVGSTAQLRDTEGVIVVFDANTTGYCQELQIGWNDGDLANMDITGGSLTVNGTLTFGRNVGSKATLYMYDGVLNVNGMIRGWHGDIYIKMTGGEMNINGTLEIPRSYASAETCAGVFDLLGGVVRADQLTLNSSQSIAICKFNITEGTLILNGDKTSRIRGYIDAGLVVAYDGLEGASISMAYNAETDKTTVIACEKAFQADFNADCVVDEVDRALLVAALGTTTEPNNAWDFDMTTDPVGTGLYELHVRNADNANYEMSGEGTLLVTGALLLDQHADATGLWDADLHYVAKAQSDEDSRLAVWITVGMGTVPGDRAYVGLSHYLNATTNTQTLLLWTGNPPHVAPFEPIMVEGFAADAMVDLTINYDFDTDTFDWTATDGTLALSGTDVPYTAFGVGSGGSFTIQGLDGTAAEIDHFSYVIHGSDTYSQFDLNQDRVVDQLDLDILEAEMAAQ